MRVALYPKDCSEDLAAALAIAGIGLNPVESIDGVVPETSGEWSVLVVELGDEPMRRLRHIDALAEQSGVPVIVVVEPAHFPLVEQSHGVADLLTSPPDPAELGLRVRRLLKLTSTDQTLHYGDLELNPLTYQATLGTDPIDLTYMEYELLRFFVEHRGTGLDPRAAALQGVGIRLLRWRPHRRRPRSPAPSQAGRGAGRVDHDRAVGRLPLRLRSRDWTA